MDSEPKAVPETVHIAGLDPVAVQHGRMAQRLEGLANLDLVSVRLLPNPEARGESLIGVKDVPVDGEDLVAGFT
jgi:hypothetical protein